ncbi:helix-turn-helix domain-containing protein [Bacillus pumilus]|jgi:DNA-binding HxlR family transcriptional regulator|uniref:winged helix-turn-helix transcriptional regulator n=1 Tax=Bacillus TaxID=1386 RepID=UPI001B3A1B3A|nr:helix-turn-helix domain-containing protein [Bacillus pumilus]MBQ4816559.1 helix-turn-helix transcriptional regulator [Bacillus pumilus]WIG31507.1 helix-turn-helix domain-containing protein [Bacillus pumilus]
MNQSDMCPRFEKAVELLSKRWVALIVFQLLSGSQRFSEIEAALTNLSGRVLSERLKELEAAGILKREVFAETPVRIEYSLTDMGRSLAPVFEEIAKWSTEWITLES